MQQRRRQPFKKRKRVPTEVFAERLRANMTRCEYLLWCKLRRIPDVHWEAQAVVYGYIPDFYCEELKLAIEVDGAVHDRPHVKRRDRHKDTVLASRGIRVMRVTNNAVLFRIWSVLRGIRNLTESIRRASKGSR